jgi:putative ABC transport system permease protein
MRIYFPAWMYPPNVDTLVLRLDKNPPQAFDDLVRRTIYNVDPDLITSKVSSIDELVAESVAYVEHYVFEVLRTLTVIGFGLAMIGVFSVIAYTVDCRMQEFGVRIAIGADSWSLRNLVLRQGLVFTAIGVVIGLAAGLGLTRFMQNMLFETTAYDPLVYGLVAATILAGGALACWIPATRASRVDVSRLLRSD